MMESRKRSDLCKSQVLRDSAVLAFKDFQRIKLNTEPGDNIRKDCNIITDEKRIQRAQEHIARIKNYDKQRLVTSIEESDFDKIQRIKNEEIIRRANEIKNHEDEAVKEMDKMILYAKVSTIRDLQLADSKQNEKVFKKKEEKWDIMSEINRLKELDKQDKIDNQRKHNQRQGALVIMDQIKAREAVRQKEKEFILKERQEMIEKMMMLDQEEAKKMKWKRIQAEELMKQMCQANDTAIQYKRQHKQDEYDLDMKLLKYNQEQARIIEEKAQTEKSIKEKKEKELQKLREHQEKFADTKTELDAIRAKRAFEFNERIKRENDKKIEQKRQLVVQDWIDSNQKIIEFKQAQWAEAAKCEQDEFEKIINRQLSENENIQKAQQSYKNKLHSHNFELWKQIKVKEEKKNLDKREVLEEGRKVRQDNEKYVQKIEDIRKSKIEYLKNWGIQPWYIADLDRFKVKYK